MKPVLTFIVVALTLCALTIAPAHATETGKSSCRSTELGTLAPDIYVSPSCDGQRQPYEALLGTNYSCESGNAATQQARKPAARACNQAACVTGEEATVLQTFAVDPTNTQRRRLIDTTTQCQPDDGEDWEGMHLQPGVARPRITSRHKTIQPGDNIRVTVDAPSHDITVPIHDGTGTLRVQPVAYTWHFGDRTSTTTHEPTTSHRIKKPTTGLINISVTIEYQGYSAFDTEPLTKIDNTIHLPSRPLTLTIGIGGGYLL